MIQKATVGDQHSFPAWRIQRWLFHGGTHTFVPFKRGLVLGISTVFLLILASACSPIFDQAPAIGEIKIRHIVVVYKCLSQILTFLDACIGERAVVCLILGISLPSGKYQYLHMTFT